MQHLSAAHIEHFQQVLRAERGRLRQEIRSHLLAADQEQYGELAGQVHDAGDESVADLLSDVNAAVVGQLITELRAVEAALQRIATGAYGLCVDCGTAIPHARLEAYPMALRCIKDQERHEKLFAGENKPAL